MDKLIELFYTSGPSVLVVAALIFFGKNIIEYFFKETVEIKKQELDQELESFRLKLKYEEDNHKLKLDQEMLRFDAELKKEINFQTNRYQIETIKINRVLPFLEELSEQIKLSKSFYLTYFNVLANRGNPAQYEATRLEIHSKLLQLSGKLDIYIPYELKKIINILIKIISNSVVDGKVFAEIYKQESTDYHRQVFLENCLTYLKCYWNSYYEIVTLYTLEFNIKAKADTRIIDILQTNDIDIQTFEILNTQIDTEIIEKLIMFREYR